MKQVLEMVWTQQIIEMYETLEELTYWVDETCGATDFFPSFSQLKYIWDEVLVEEKDYFLDGDEEYDDEAAFKACFEFSFPKLFSAD